MLEHRKLRLCVTVRGHRIELWATTVNSISATGMLTPSHLPAQKGKPRWPPTGVNFVRQFQSSSRSCTSVPVPYTTLISKFCLVRLRKHSQPWKKCSGEILLVQFYIKEHLKEFIIAVWSKKCAKLSKGSKLTAESGRAFGSFLKSFFQIVLSCFALV